MINVIGGLLILSIIAWCLSLTFWSLIKSAHEWAIYWVLRNQGKPNRAIMSKLWSTPNGRTHKFMLLYEFDDGSEIYRNEQQISQRHYRRLMKKSQEVSISFLPAKPHISRLSQDDKDYTARDGYTFVGWVSIIIFPPIVILWIIIFLYLIRQLSN